MGKKNSKLQGNTLEKLTAETYCEHYFLCLLNHQVTVAFLVFLIPDFFFLFQSLRKRSSNGTKDFSRTVPTVCSPSRASSRSTPNSSPTETRQSSPRLYFAYLTKIRMAQLNSRSLFERSPSRLAATLTKNSIVSPGPSQGQKIRGGGHIVLWWTLSVSLVEIGLTVLPKTALNSDNGRKRKGGWIKENEMKEMMRWPLKVIQLVFNFSLTGAFRLYDVDNDGYITRQEMYDIVDAIYQMVVRYGFYLTNLSI